MKKGDQIAHELAPYPASIVAIQRRNPQRSNIDQNVRNSQICDENIGNGPHFSIFSNNRQHQKVAAQSEGENDAI